MVPSGPVPRMLLISTPFSLARRRALGEICTLDLAVASPGALSHCTTEGAVAAAAVVWAVGAAAGDSTGGCSPGATSHAIVVPTGTTSPSRDLTPASRPFAVASISTTALSFSASSRIWAFATVSPSFFTQETIFPVSCAISSAGITTLIAIGFQCDVMQPQRHKGTRRGLQQLFDCPPSLYVRVFVVASNIAEV